MPSQMIVLPPLECGTGIVRMVAIDLDKFVQDASCQVHILVPNMVPQDQEDLIYRGMS